MQSPLATIESAEIARATHAMGENSLRLEFAGGRILIAYNKCLFDGRRVQIDSPSREFAVLVGMKLQSIVESKLGLEFEISENHHVRIGTVDEVIEGPEAFQLILPGYPPVVQQNP
jgi:hypothetical protein